MTTYTVIAWDGRTKLITTRTESEARQIAVEFCGDAGIWSFEVN